MYAHGNGSLKSHFYDAFVSIHRGLFNTRNRADHARKRKIVSHIFSQKNVLEFEPIARLYIDQLLKQWDRLYDAALKDASGTEGEGWYGKDGRLWLDCLPCMRNVFMMIITLKFLQGIITLPLTSLVCVAPSSCSHESIDLL